ncbi:hypothetical protein BJY52DRAFT_1206753 [Lactarius psammicola]|nr:hypothetical protein BJY52DRAFT_1206753 [Lactarius psammicola]
MHNTTGDLIWAPFRSQCDWEIAHWAKMRGPTSTAVMELLAIPEVVDRLGLSYRTTKELNDIIDKALPSHTPFQCEDLTIEGEELQFHYHEIIPCIWNLFGNPEFVGNLVYAPERHYMHTGEWWWTVQMSLEARNPGATVIPLIISTDKTQLTLFCGKAAYPIYLGIGNIPKDIHRKLSRYAQMLIGYIPTTKLVCFTNKTARRRALANLFHSCMGKVLDPIRTCGETGLATLSGDGTWHRCHPIFATFVGDYLEQTLVTCTLNGHCPKCLVPPNQLGNFWHFPARNHMKVLDTYNLANEHTHQFHATCRAKGLKPGVVKHITAWLSDPTVFGAVEVDMCCHSLPPNHYITLFPNGITTLLRKEHKDMCRFLLSLVVDLHLPGGQVASRVLRAVHALLDFVHLAQYPSHMTETLNHLEQSLTHFHENKAIFFDLGVRNHLNIPKFHSLLHYGRSITFFGTTDNYNTEQSERLHIDFTKDMYQATNRKDEYAQMTAWLERHEKIQIHCATIKRWQQGYPASIPTSMPIGPLQVSVRYLKMARNPTIKAITFGDLAMKYGAINFQDALADFIALTNYPDTLVAMLRTWAADTLIPFQSLPVFHRMKFTSSSNPEDLEIVDSVVVRPEQRDARGRIVPSWFDTVLVRGKHQDVMHGTNGNRIAQIQVIFQIPTQVTCSVFLNDNAPTYLAYTEWFSPLSQTPDGNHHMHKVSRLAVGGRRRASVIPVDSIIGSVHLIPRFGLATPRDWNSFLVLELCDTFYVNPFSNRDNYLRFG